MRNISNHVGSLLSVFLMFALVFIGHDSDALAQSGFSLPAHNSIIKIDEGEALPAYKNIVIGLNKSVMIELPTEVRDVLVSSPKVLDAVMHTSKRAYIIGLKEGQANAFIFDKSGKQILTLDITIERDLTGLVKMIQRIVPGSKVHAEMVNDNIILTGNVMHPSDATKASSIASRFVTDKEKVLNMLSVTAKEQVMLRVTVSEMNREAIKRLGINWNGGSVGRRNMGHATNNGFPITNQSGANSFLTGIIGPDPSACSTLPGSANILVPSLTFGNSISCLAATLEALERTNLVRTLAEPNLTAISGEAAKFLAGGEFPIPVSVDNGQIGVEWKPFGVGLAFTPLVLSEGRISLKVSTEVSELSSEGAVQVSSFSIPALKVRRAETTVELPSGGSFVIAGLLSDDTKQNLDGVPGLKKIPILGKLFRSRDYQRKETELVVLVTPYMVKPVNRNKLALPDEGFIPPNDKQVNFFGQLNRVYGRRERALPAGDYKGDYGFIVK